MAKVVLVLGMHRSGTSAMARSLQVLGASLGEDLLPAVEGDNDKGFWEDVDLYRLNEALLEKVGAGWSSLAGLDKDFLSDEFLAERERAVELLSQRLNKTAVFAFKDPRSVNVLPFWKSVFKLMGVDASYLIALRNPLSVAESLLKRNGFDEQKSYMLWAKHTINSLRHTHKCTRVIVDYDLLLDAPSIQLKRMADALALSLPESDSFEYKSYVDDFLASNLRHSEYSLGELQEGEVPPLVVSLYLLMLDAAKGLVALDDLQCCSEWETIKDQFDDFSSVLGYIDSLDCELNTKLLELEQQESTYKKLDKKAVLIEQRLLESRHYSGELLGRHENLYSRFTLLSERVEEYKSSISRLKEDLGKMQVYKQEQQALLELKVKNLTEIKSLRLTAEKYKMSQDTLQIQLERYKVSQDKLQVQLERYKASQVKLQAERRELVASKQAVSSQLLRIKNKISSIESSFSWRITYPLRVLSRAFKGCLRGGRGLCVSCARLGWRALPLSGRCKYRVAGVIHRKLPGLVPSQVDSVPELKRAEKVIHVAPKDLLVGGKILRKEEGATGGQVLLTCWLATEDPIVDALVELSEQLRRLGLMTVFAGQTQLFKKRGREHLVQTPLLLSDTNYNVGAEAPLPEWIDYIYLAELAWHPECDAKKTCFIQEKCNQAYSYWLQYLLTNRPAYLLIWGGTAPLSRLLLRLANSLSLPYIVLERGHFLGTLLLDTHGQGGESEKVIRPIDMLQGSHVGLEDILAWEKTVDNKVPYADANLDLNQKFIERVSGSGKRVVLYMGANDRGAGCTRLASDPERCSFIFGDSFEAVEYLQSIQEALFSDCLLVVKPHPSDKRDYGSLSSKELFVASDVNINQLIKMSDVCVSTSTTAFAKCIVESKPIVTLAISDLSYKDIAYECESLTAVAVMLRAALDRDRFEQKTKNGMGYINSLFQSSLVSVAFDAPTRLKLSDLSSLIYKRYLARGGCVSPVVSQKTSVEIISAAVDVIIPVYGDVEATKNCIDSVLSSRDQVKYRVILVNDKSPYSEIKELVESYGTSDDLLLLSNDVNLGFTGAVNRALAYSTADVVVLNSDTIVAKGWVDRLYCHAKSSSNIATVTPFSNNASIFSCKNTPVGFDLSADFDCTKFDAGLSLINKGIAVETPVGHGFCLFINRTCLDRVGYLDQVVFGKGYSEEVDFCLRARSIGFIHLCATDVFVAHVGGLSFMETADERRLANRKVIEKRYPGYFDEIKSFIALDPLSPYRQD